MEYAKHYGGEYSECFALAGLTFIVDKSKRIESKPDIKTVIDQCLPTHLFIKESTTMTTNNNSTHQYTFSEVESLLNEKRDIAQKNAALKAEIAEVEAATIKVDSNEEIINNRVEAIKFDIAKGKETYSDLEDRLAELEDKKERVEEQQQIFQLFEKFDDSFTVPTVELVKNTPVADTRLKISDIASEDEILEAASSVISEGNLNDLLKLSSNPLKYYTEEQFGLVAASFKCSNTNLYKLEPREVLDVLGRQYVILRVLTTAEQFTVHYTEEQKLEVVAELLLRERLFAKDDYEEACSFLIMSQLEEFPTILNSCPIKVEGKNIKQVISNAESEPFSIPTYIEEDYTEEEIEILATTNQLTPEQNKEFYTRITPNALLVEEYIKKAKSNSSSTNSSWVKNTLMEAVTSADPTIDEDCLDYIWDIVKRINPYDIYTKETHDFIVGRLHKESSQIRKDCAVYLEYVLRYYFDTDFKEDLQMDEKTFNKVSNYLQNFSKK